MLISAAFSASAQKTTYVKESINAPNQSGGVSAQTTSVTDSIKLFLLPSPQRLTLTGGTVDLDTYRHINIIFDTFVTSGTLDPEIKDAVIISNSDKLKKFIVKYNKKGEKYCLFERTDTLPVPCNHSQAYILTVTPQYIHILYTSLQGCRYALLTLEQLLQNNRFNNRSTPCLEIVDWPAFQYRGWLDDISRGPIPTATFLKQEEVLGNYKMNFANLYTEHTLINEKHNDVAPADGIGKDIIDAHRAPLFSQMANLQVFAHAEKTLRIPYYQNMMDTRRNFNPGSEDTYHYLEDILEHAVRQYPDAQFFNIDCDETEGLGTGRGRSYVDSIGGVDEAYIRHINRVYDILEPFGKRVLMWGDIVAKKPEMMQQMPEKMEYIMWNYAPMDSYVESLEPFAMLHRQQGNAFWVAPSVAHHGAVHPNPSTYMQNIAYLARDGHYAQACGLMATSWDDGGEELFDDSWHGMLFAAEMAWNPLKNTVPMLAKEEMKQRVEQFNRTFDKLFAQRDGTADLLTKVAALEHDPDIADWYIISSIYQPLYSFYPSLVDSTMENRIKRVLPKLQALEAEIHDLNDLDLPVCNILDHARYALHHIEATVHKCQLRREIYLMLHNDTEALSQQQIKDIAATYLQELHALKKEYLRLWDRECCEYSRQTVCDRFDQLGFEVLDLDRHVFVEVKNDGTNNHVNTSAKKGMKLNNESKAYVTLRTLFDNHSIYYTLDGRKPSQGSQLYAQTFPIDRSCLLKAVAFNQYGEGVYTKQYLLKHLAVGCPIKLATPFSTYRSTYSGGGNSALVDGQLGSDDNYSDGHWQGYWGQDIDASIDLGANKEIHNISIRFLQNAFDWILAPTELRFYTSPDGKTWTLARTESFTPEFAQNGNVIYTYALRDLNATARYIRIVVPNPGPLPSWHSGKGQPSYLFADEIVVE